MKREDCIRELKIHGLAQQTLNSDGNQSWVLTNKAVDLISECWTSMRERFPDASEEDVTSRALIVFVLDRLGLVNRRNLPDYLAAIKALAANWKAP